MKRFNVSQYRLNKMKKLYIAVTVISGLAFLYSASELMELSSYERKEYGGFFYFYMAMSACGLVFDILGAYAYANLRNHYLLVEADKVSGAGSREQNNCGDTQAFSVKFEELVYVENLADSAKKRFYTMRVDTKYGSYYLCVEHAENAIREIDACRQAAKKKAESHAHQ